LGPARASAAARHTPSLGPANTVIDGPSPSITGLTGLAVARDGTGGLVYLKSVAGATHVFLSRLLAGVFQPPVQVDVGTGLTGASSQPVIAASAPGKLVIAFINGGGLYTAQALDSQSPISSPNLLFPTAGEPSASASGPALAISAFGKAYLAFTATDASGSDVRAGYFYQGVWGLESPPLSLSHTDGAGIGLARPAVAVAGDGVGIVAWGENSHVYSRRVSGLQPSVVDEQADVSMNPLESADQPVVASGGDSSYAILAYRELPDGPAQPSRVLMDRLRGSSFDQIGAADASPSGQGADQPQAAVTEYGAGFVTAEYDQSHDLYGASLNNNESFAGVAQRLNGQSESAAPDAVPAAAGLYSTLVAFQQAPGSDGQPEIRVRYAPFNLSLGPEQVVSSPALGPTDAASGLVAGGDIAGDAAIAWVQGLGASAQIVAAQLYQPPGGFAPASTFSYSTSAQPVLSWSAASEPWGTVGYAVTLDRNLIATTTGTQVQVPSPVPDGRHSLQVTAINQAGQRTAAAPETVFVDTVAPQASIRVTGSRRLGNALHLGVAAVDVPAPSTGAAASGVATVQVKWGDGAKAFIPQAATIQQTATHAYRRRGTYGLTVIVKDRAGNRTVVTRELTIRPKPKPRPKRKAKPKPKPKPGHRAHNGRRP